MATSSIEWTEMTWNPTTGCTKITAGCKFCYAEVMAKRLQAMGLKKYENGFKLAVHPETLIQPYSWAKPKIVFVNSMSDLFHEKIPVEYIQQVFRVMNDNPQHTFQVLTKRADRVLELSPELKWGRNIWMGVSVENDLVLDRVAALKKTKAKVKFLSCEPLIGPLTGLNVKGIDWVIAGGESGHKARPVQPEWIEDIRLKCQKAKVAFFFKQWGKSAFNPDIEDPTIQSDHQHHAKGGCSINGRIYREMPPVGIAR